MARRIRSALVRRRPYGLLAITVCISACLGSCSSEATPAAEASEPVSPLVAAQVYQPSDEIRATGVVKAARFVTIQTPRMAGPSSRLTLVKIIPNGAIVEEGEVLAQFDATTELDAARQAQAMYDDLSHQVEQKRAENAAAAAQRGLELKEAAAALEEARIQLRKGTLLSEIDRLQNEVRAAAAEKNVVSLEKSSQFRQQAEAAALRVLELQRERQSVALERSEGNLSKLVVLAPLGGMAALETMYQNGTMAFAQEGDQIYPGRILMRIFDRTQMEIEARIAEPDGGRIVPGTHARVLLDAYPGVEFRAELQSASPVASAALGSPVKTFLARFRLQDTDPRLLPDLSALVIIQVGDRE